jgi:hypothetical protein
LSRAVVVPVWVAALSLRGVRRRGNQPTPRSGRAIQPLPDLSWFSRLVTGGGSGQPPASRPLWKRVPRCNRGAGGARCSRRRRHKAGVTANYQKPGIATSSDSSQRQSVPVYACFPSSSSQSDPSPTPPWQSSPVIYVPQIHEYGVAHDRRLDNRQQQPAGTQGQTRTKLCSNTSTFQKKTQSESCRTRFGTRSTNYF